MVRLAGASALAVVATFTLLFFRASAILHIGIATFALSFWHSLLFRAGAFGGFVTTGLTFTFTIFALTHWANLFHFVHIFVLNICHPRARPGDPVQYFYYL
jgi:hypothetical protein